MHASQVKATDIYCALLLVLGRLGGVESQRSLGVLCSHAFLSARVFFLADVNVAFQQSAHKVLLDDDNLLPLLHLTIEYHGKEHKGLPFFLLPFCSCWSSSVLPSTSTETISFWTLEVT